MQVSAASQLRLVSRAVRMQELWDFARLEGLYAAQVQWPTACFLLAVFCFFSQLPLAEVWHCLSSYGQPPETSQLPTVASMVLCTCASFTTSFTR